MKAPANPTSREILAPIRTRNNKSRPLRSVPKKCASEGGRKLSRVTSPESRGMKVGPKMAENATRMRMTIDRTAAGLLCSLLHGDRYLVIDRDPAVKEPVHHVDHEVEDHQQCAVNNDYTGEQESIAVQD